MATTAVTMTGEDVVTQALHEIGVVNATDPAAGEDLDFGLAKANRILDRWNATRQAVYHNVFASYVLTPSLQPHTIGPTGTFTLEQRPVSVDDANLVLTSTSPNIRQPINLRDATWWARQSVQGVSTSIPTDLYYEPDWPNGKLFLWPVPLTAYSLELQTRVLLAAMTLVGDIVLPTGYRDAFVLTLAESLVGPFRVPMPETLPALAREARAVIFGNNIEVPRLTTRDAGMPGGGGGGFNYLTGS